MTAAIVNPLGHTTTNQYTTATGPDGTPYYQLTSVSDNAVADCGASNSARSYDGNGNLAQTVDANGVTHTYTYAANGQLQTETEASGTSVARKTDYVWDPDQQLNRLLSVTVEGETRTDYTYNAQNRIASITRTNLSSVGTPNQGGIGQAYTYTLYGNGMVATMTVATSSPGGTDTVTTHYDTLGNVTSVADGLGHTTTYSNYNGLGEPGKVVGPNGDEIDYAYDARGRVATKTTHPFGAPSTWTYSYDGFGLLSQVVDYDGTTTWTRDAEMRVTSITHDDRDGTSTESFTYDANGDVTSDVVARGSDIGKSTTTVYDALGRVYQRKGNHGQVLTYAYDGNGNVLSVTDALGHKTSYQYDALDRVTKRVDANGGVTQYAYDAGDHLTKVTDPRGLVTTYSYDGLGLLWKQVSPDTGTTSFSYDAYARLASKTRADGVQTTYSYDSMNRLTRATAGGTSQSWSYDTCTDGLGRLCSVTDADTATAYSYSAEGWVVGRGFNVGGKVYSLGYSYDQVGRRTVVVYPDGNSASYYNYKGSIFQVELNINGAQSSGVTGISYRPGNLAMSSWTSSNGLTNTIAYDNDLRPTGITVPGVENLGFSYDAADRLTQITNGLDGTMTQTLGYDALDRLTSVVSGADNESYTYDADGNRLSANLNGVAWSYTPDASSNRMIHAAHGTWSASYDYDAQGNTLGTTHQYWTYDAFGRMRTATPLSGSPVTTYDVNPEGQRLRKSTPADSTWFAPDLDGALLAEDDNGAWTDYVWLNGRLVGMLANGGLYAVHDDQTGRPQAITEPASANIDWAARNMAFTRTVTTDALGGDFNLGFPGQYYDAEVDKWYNGRRDYDAALGRYIESDPIGLRGGINTYAYVGDNPISNVDPIGLMNFLIGYGANAVGGLGAHNSTGIFITFPFFDGAKFNAGAYNSFGAAGGGNVGADVEFGFISGDKSNIQGVTRDISGGAAFGSISLMYDTDGSAAGFLVGPAADLGISGAVTTTSAWGADDLGQWLGGMYLNWIYGPDGPYAATAARGSNCP